MSGHPGVVTAIGCPLCDGLCKHPWSLPNVHATYPFLPAEMVAQMQPVEPDSQEGAPAPEPPPPVRGRRRGQNRMKPAGDDTAKQPGENRAAD